MSVRIKVWVQPGASRDRVVGMHGDALKICVSAPPEKGRANRCVEKVLAHALGVKKSCVRVTAGAASREKTVEIEGAEEGGVAAAMDRWRHQG